MLRMIASFLSFAILILCWSLGLASKRVSPPSSVLRAHNLKPGRGTLLTGGAVVYPVTEVLHLTSAVSGETVSYNNKNEIVDPTEAAFYGSTRRGRRDRRLAVTGSKKFVVVRVTCGQHVVTKSLEEIKADVFSDAVCLKSQLEACSNNAVTISEGYNNGGIDLAITSCSTVDAAEFAVTIALTSLLGYDPTRAGEDYFMYCLPNVYGNFGMGRTNSQQSSDLTGVMGGNFAIDDYSMCYNAPNMYQLGWLTKVTEFTARPASGNYVLVGHTNFEGGVQTIRLQGTPTSGEDTFIWFNHASGINANTVDGKNRVIVTTTGLPYGYTFRQAILDVGQSYSPIGSYYAVQVLSIGSGQATITFDASPSNAPVTAPPTAPPVMPSPTVSPVTPPPTASPMTPPPTASPVTPPPTNAPVTPPPTASPVTPPPTNEVTGSKKFVVVRVTCGQHVVTKSLEEIKANKCPSDASTNSFPNYYSTNKCPSDASTNRFPSDATTNKCPNYYSTYCFPSDATTNRCPSDASNNCCPSARSNDCPSCGSKSGTGDIVYEEDECCTRLGIFFFFDPYHRRRGLILMTRLFEPFKQQQQLRQRQHSPRES